MEIQSLLPTKGQIESTLGNALKDLPAFPVVAAKLLEMTRNERMSTADIAKVVETDPTIAAKVLTIVNSAAFGSLRRISSIRHAVVLLGTSEIRAIALGVTLFENVIKHSRQSKFDRVVFWKHSLAIAGICRVMAEQTGYSDPDEAYVAGLLHDIGKIILDASSRVDYGGFVTGLDEYLGPIVERERRDIGLGHDDIGAYYCDGWNMPDRLVLPVLLHHQRFSHLELSQDEALLVGIVSLADFIAWTQGVGSLDALRHPILHPDVESVINLETLNLTALMATMDREVNGTADFYGFNFPSADQFREKLLRTNIKLSQINTKYFYQYGDLKREIQSLNRLRESITTPHRSLAPNDIIENTLQSIQKGFGFDRLFLMKIDPVHRNLTTLQSLDTTDLGIDLDRLDIRIVERSGGFIDCLRNHVPALIAGANDDESRVLAYLNSRQIGIVPYTVNNKVMGVLGVDNPVSAKTIHFSDLTALTLVANELGLALQNAKTFEEIQNRASYDGLTGVFNRAHIESYLKKSFKKAKTGAMKLSVAMVDVDYFKRFNDTFGHLAGDSILKLIAGSLMKFSRPTEVVGRYGGEKFLSVLEDTDLTNARLYGERIRKKIEDLGDLLANRFPGQPLTVSIGAATFLPHMDNEKSLIAAADKALYSAKDKGRNRVVIAEESAPVKPEN